MQKANPHAARELALYIINETDFPLYSLIESAIENLKNHIERGVYNHEKALISWKHIADTGAKLYSGGYNSNIFNVAERKAAAAELAGYYEEELGLSEQPIKINLQA